MHPLRSIGTRLAIQSQHQQDVIGGDHAVSRDVPHAPRRTPILGKDVQNVGGPMNAVSVEVARAIGIGTSIHATRIGLCGGRVEVAGGRMVQPDTGDEDILGSICPLANPPGSDQKAASLSDVGQVADHSATGSGKPIIQSVVQHEFVATVGEVQGIPRDGLGCEMLAARNGASSAVEYVPCRLQRVAVGSRFDDEGRFPYVPRCAPGCSRPLRRCSSSPLHVTVYADDRQDSPRASPKSSALLERRQGRWSVSLAARIHRTRCRWHPGGRGHEGVLPALRNASFAPGASAMGGPCAEDADGGRIPVGTEYSGAFQTPSVGGQQEFGGPADREVEHSTSAGPPYRAPEAGTGREHVHAGIRTRIQVACLDIPRQGIHRQREPPPTSATPPLLRLTRASASPSKASQRMSSSSLSITASNTGNPGQPVAVHDERSVVRYANVPADHSHLVDRAQCEHLKRATGSALVCNQFIPPSSLQYSRRLATNTGSDWPKKGQRACPNHRAPPPRPVASNPFRPAPSGVLRAESASEVLRGIDRIRRPCEQAVEAVCSRTRACTPSFRALIPLSCHPASKRSGRSSACPMR